MDAEQYQSALNKRIEAQQRQRTRQAAKLADPAYRQAQYDRQAASTARTLARQIERRNSPEFKAKQKETAAKRAQRAIESAETKRQVKPKTSTKKRAVTSGRGLLGRKATAAEKVIMDALGKLPCIACHQHGKESPLISLHHIDGRTKPNAHKKQLPLCRWHHQDAAPAEDRATYPWLVPVHASGIVGGPKEFNEQNGTELELMEKAYALAGISHLLETIEDV